MNRMRAYIVITLLISVLSAWGQSEQPEINPTAVFTSFDGQQEETNQYSGLGYSVRCIKEKE